MQILKSNPNAYLFDWEARFDLIYVNIFDLRRALVTPSGAPLLSVVS
jgi:hypothetical protein